MPPDKEDSPDGKNSFPEEFSQFSDDWSMLGFKFIFGSAAAGILFRKILWVVFFLFACIVALYLIREKFYHWLSNPKTITVDTIYVNKLPYPAITICNENSVRLTELQNMGLYDLFMEDQSFIYDNNQSDWPSDDGNQYWLLEGICEITVDNVTEAISNGRMVILNEVSREVCRSYCSTVYGQHCNGFLYSRLDRSCVMSFYNGDYVYEDSNCKDKTHLEFYKRERTIPTASIYCNFENRESDECKLKNFNEEQEQWVTTNAEYVFTRADVTTNSANGRISHTFETPLRSGVSSGWTTEVANTTGTCLEMFYWLKGPGTKLTILYLSMDSMSSKWETWYVTSYSGDDWSHIYIELPDGVNQINVTVTRSDEGVSAAAIDDFAIGLCSEFDDENECKSDALGRTYQGRQSWSISNKTCLEWKNFPEMMSQFSLEKKTDVGNYCRYVPGQGWSAPSCLVQLRDNTVRVEQCDIPYCDCRSKSEVKCKNGKCVPLSKICSDVDICEREPFQEEPRCENEASVRCFFTDPYICGYTVHSTGAYKWKHFSEPVKNELQYPIKQYLLPANDRDGYQGISICVPPGKYYFVFDGENADPLNPSNIRIRYINIRSPYECDPDSYYDTKPDGFRGDICVFGGAGCGILFSTFTLPEPDYLLDISAADSSGRDCNATIKQENGRVVSQNYPNNYPANTNCYYNVLTNSNEDQILVEFMSFHLEYPDYRQICNYDFVQFTCQYKENGKISTFESEKFCGVRLPQNLPRNCFNITIYFKTDNSQQYSGFELLFSVAKNLADYDKVKPSLLKLAMPESMGYQRINEHTLQLISPIYRNDNSKEKCLHLSYASAAAHSIYLQYIANGSVTKFDLHKKFFVGHWLALQKFKVSIFPEMIGAAEEFLVILEIKARWRRTLAVVESIVLANGECSNNEVLERKSFNCSFEEHSMCDYRDVSKGLNHWVLADRALVTEFLIGNYDFESALRSPTVTTTSDGLVHIDVRANSMDITCTVVLYTSNDKEIDRKLFSHISNSSVTRLRSGPPGESIHIAFHVPKGSHYFVLTAGHKVKYPEPLLVGIIQIEWRNIDEDDDIDSQIKKTNNQRSPRCKFRKHASHCRPDFRTTKADHEGVATDSSMEEYISEEYNSEEYNSGQSKSVVIVSPFLTIEEDRFIKVAFTRNVSNMRINIYEAYASGALNDVIISQWESKDNKNVSQANICMPAGEYRYGIVLFSDDITVKEIDKILLKTEACQMEDRKEKLGGILLKSALSLTSQKSAGKWINLNSGMDCVALESSTDGFLKLDIFRILYNNFHLYINGSGKTEFTVTLNFNEPNNAATLCKDIIVETFSSGDYRQSPNDISSTNNKLSATSENGILRLTVPNKCLSSLTIGSISYTASPENLDEYYPAIVLNERYLNYSGEVYEWSSEIFSTQNSVAFLQFSAKLRRDAVLKIIVLYCKSKSATGKDLEKCFKSKTILILSGNDKYSGLLREEFPDGDQIVQFVAQISNVNKNNLEASSLFSSFSAKIIKNMKTKKIDFTVWVGDESRRHCRLDLTNDCGFSDHSTGNSRWVFAQTKTSKESSFKRVFRVSDVECLLKNSRGETYIGTTNKTISGRICQNWNSQTPHRHLFNSKNDFKDGLKGLESNYCRNPNSASAPWCYTRDEKQEIEYCNIPTCTESYAKVYITKSFQPVKLRMKPIQFDYDACFFAMFNSSNKAVQLKLSATLSAENKPFAEKTLSYTDKDVHWGYIKLPLSGHQGKEIFIQFTAMVQSPITDANRWDNSVVIDTVVTGKGLCGHPSEADTKTNSRQLVRYKGEPLKPRMYMKKLLQETNGKNITMQDLFNQTGPKLDTMFLSCYLEDKQQECSEIFQEELTDMGKCFTFNKNFTHRFNATQAGAKHGLQVTLFLEEFESVKSFTQVSGVKIDVYSQDDVPFVRDMGFAASPGYQTLIAFSYSNATILPWPFGNCTKTDEPMKYYSPPYSPKKCLVEADLNSMIDLCGCKHAYMPNNDIPICNIESSLKCDLEVYGAKGNSSREQTCMAACTSESFQPFLSQSKLSSHTVSQFKKQAKELTAKLPATLNLQDRLDNSKMKDIFVKMGDLIDSLEKLYVMLNQQSQNTSTRKTVENALNSLGQMKVVDVLIFNKTFFSFSKEYDTHYKFFFDEFENGIQQYRAFFLKFVDYAKGLNSLINAANIKTLFEKKFEAFLVKISIGFWKTRSLLERHGVSTSLSQYSFTQKEFMKNLTYIYNPLIKDILKLLDDDSNAELRSTLMEKAQSAAGDLQENLNSFLAYYAYLKSTEAWIQANIRRDKYMRKTRSKSMINLVNYTATLKGIRYLYSLNMESKAEIATSFEKINVGIYDLMDKITEETNAAFTDLLNHIKQKEKSIQDTYTELINHVEKLNGFAHREFGETMKDTIETCVRKFWIWKKPTPDFSEGRVVIYKYDYYKKMEEIWSENQKLPTFLSTSGRLFLRQNVEEFTDILEKKLTQLRDDMIDTIIAVKDALHFLDKFLGKFENSINIDEQFIRKNFMKLDFYYTEMKHGIMKQSEEYDWKDLLSDIGGFLGLCVGACLLTLFELVDFLIFYFYNLRR